ncbi:hypothetical protein Tco_0794592 [Tanacetum coccineum]
MGKPTPLPKKKKTFSVNLSGPSLKPNSKTSSASYRSKTNGYLCVPMSTGVKPTSGAAKTECLTREPRTHSFLPVKSANARRLNNVCAACNKSLVFANHTDCLVMCDGSVNVKPHQTKRFKRQPKKEWKPIKRVWKPISKPVANSKPQWKPTGRHFSLFEKYPLTRIMEPTDMPIELPPSASSSPQITMVVQIVLWYLDDSGMLQTYIGCDRERLINFVEKFIGTVRFSNDEYAAIVGYVFVDGGLELLPKQFMSHPQLDYGGSTHNGSENPTVLHSLNDYDGQLHLFACLQTPLHEVWLWHLSLTHLNFGTLERIGSEKNLVRASWKGPIMNCYKGKKPNLQYFEYLDPSHQEGLPNLQQTISGKIRKPFMLPVEKLTEGVDDAAVLPLERHRTTSVPPLQRNGRRLVSMALMMIEVVSDTSGCPYLSYVPGCPAHVTPNTITSRAKVDQAHAEKHIGNKRLDLSLPEKLRKPTMRWIFRYLKGTIHMGLWYSKDSGFELKAFVDADYAGCHDTRRSTSGSAQFLGHRLVSWSSKKQKSLCHLHTEVEYIAYPDCSCSNPLVAVQHLRSKHIDIRHHFIKEQVERKVVELYFVETKYQLADIFTKALPRERFATLLPLLGVKQMSPET